MPSLPTTILLSLLPFLPDLVSAHGYITSPQARITGPAMGTACGSQILSNQASDTYGNIQGELQVAGTDFNAEACHIWLCKGFQFADQPTSNIQSYTAGQTVPIHFDIRAPHDGTANVSIVDTASNSIITQLKYFSQYALTSRPIQSDETDFDVTIPTDLGGKCQTAGECVIQMWWDARSIDQTYESCIDFVVEGSGSGSGASSSSSKTSVGVSTSATASTSASSTRVSSVASSSASASTSTTSALTSASASSNASVSKPASSAVSSKPASVTRSASSSAQVTTSAIVSNPSTIASEVFTLTAGTTTLLCREEL